MLGRGEWLGVARKAALAAVLLAATSYFLVFVHAFYPIQHWLFWRYAAYWLASAVFAASCFACGHALLHKGLRLSLGGLEHVAVAFSVGVFLFELGLFVLGLFRLLRPWMFYAYPLALLALTGWPAFRYLRRALRARRRQREQAPKLTLPTALLVALGCIGLSLVYIPLLTPTTAQYDALWKHLTLAEDYLAHGGVRYSVEGQLFATRAHMTSFLYAWGFLFPTGRLFDQIEMAQHLEFTVFLVTTLCAIPALVRRLAPRADPRWVWFFRFAFPGVFVYDSMLSAGADHVGASFAVPLALVLILFWKTGLVRYGALLGLLMAAAALTKETSAILLVPGPVLAVTWRGARELVRALRRRDGALARRAALAPVVTAASALVFTAPLWLKNWIWYGAPLYPMGSGVFTLHPWTEVAAYKFAAGYEQGQMWSPRRDWTGLVNSLRTLVTFSFVPNDWVQMHGKVPVFGSLFTLLLPAFLFAKGPRRRTWWLIAWIHLALFSWYWVHHQDRYLQGILPLMAAATGSMAIAVWRSGGILVRGGVTLLFSAQLAWGGDTPFFATHLIAGSPFKNVIDLLGTGYRKDYDKRLDISAFSALNAHLPKGSRVLFHEENRTLGLRAERILDQSMWRYGFEYDLAGSPRGMWQLMQRLGATHIFYRPGRSRGEDSVAADILFFDFVHRYESAAVSVAGGRLVRVPDVAPSDQWNDRVVFMTCGADTYQRGLYEVRQATVPPYGPRRHDYPKPEVAAETLDQDLALVDRAHYVVRDPACFPAVPAALAPFESLVTRVSRGRKLEIWVRRAAQ